MPLVHAFEGLALRREGVTRTPVPAWSTKQNPRGLVAPSPGTDTGTNGLRIRNRRRWVESGVWQARLQGTLPACPTTASDGHPCHTGTQGTGTTVRGHSARIM